MAYKKLNSCFLFQGSKLQIVDIFYAKKLDKVKTQHFQPSFQHKLDEITLFEGGFSKFSTNFSTSYKIILIDKLHFLPKNRVTR